MFRLILLTAFILLLAATYSYGGPFPSKIIGSAVKDRLTNGSGGGGGGPAVGDGLVLEINSDFVLLETGDYLLLE
jgi:hypothetical protein